MNASEPLPSLSGATAWLNSTPLTTTGLRGRVVVVDFCTYSCINWIRTLPYVRAWIRRYEADGLTVIGVHSPEFAFEHDVRAVADNIKQRNVAYPVAIDNDFAIWSAFGNRYWPAIYIADANGGIRYHHFGEGEYEQTERAIRQLLAAPASTMESELVSVDSRGDELPADWSVLKSPETYLGYERTQKFASPSGAIPDHSQGYALPAQLGLNQWALSGVWTIDTQSVSLDEPRGQIACRFHARDLHLVMGCAGPDPVSFRVTVDGQPPGASHGIDTDEQGNGAVSKPRLYQLIRQSGPVVERSFDITFDDAGVDAYVFTFG